MAQDVAIDIYAKISAAFEQRVKNDPEAARYRKRIEADKADLSDVSLYARRLGELASETLIEGLNEDELPNGVIYWNVAEKTILPLLKRVHTIVNEAGIKVQKVEDEKAKLGINAIAADFPEERARALIQKIVDKSGEVETDGERRSN